MRAVFRLDFQYFLDSESQNKMVNSTDFVTVLICGGRDYTEEGVVEEIIKTLIKQVGTRTLVIVHGGATGADSLAEKVCLRLGVCVVNSKALWEAFGKAAGPKRNKFMLEYFNPRLVVAFPGGDGTENMRSLAIAANVPVESINS